MYYHVEIEMYRGYDHLGVLILLSNDFGLGQERQEEIKDRAYGNPCTCEILVDGLIS